MDISVASVYNRSTENAVQLMNAYLDTDARVRPFLQLVKYWAKRKTLADGMNRINTYGFALMAIKYMQECEPTPILPILQLKNDNVITVVPLGEANETNRLCLGELMFQFFQFWKTFDYGLHYVSIVQKGTFSGDVSSLKHFLSIPQDVFLNQSLVASRSWPKCERIG